MRYTKRILIKKETIEDIRTLMREHEKPKLTNVLTANYDNVDGNTDISIAIALTQDNSYQALLYDDCRICAKGDKRYVLSGEWEIEFRGNKYAFIIELDEEAEKCERRRPFPEMADCLYYLEKYYSGYPKYNAEWILDCIGRTILKDKFNNWKKEKSPKLDY